MTEPSHERLLTIPQLASLLRVATSNIYQLIGEGLPYRYLDGQPRLAPREVSAWLLRNEQKRGHKRARG